MGVPQKSTRTKMRRRLRDIDQICQDLKSPKHLAEHKNSKAADELPGGLDIYCTPCAKWFESEYNRAAHLKGSTHRRRMKALKEGPYTQKDAEAAIGFRTDNRALEQSRQEDNMDIEVKMPGTGTSTGSST